MFKLMQAFEKVMKRFQDRENKPQHVVVKYNYTMEGQRTHLLDYMKANTRVAFESIFSQCENRIHAIFNFLALLELVQQRFLGILIGTGRNNFIIEWNTEQGMQQEEEGANLPSDDNENEPLA
jgi:segregation and condensation protein A